MDDWLSQTPCTTRALSELGNRSSLRAPAVWGSPFSLPFLSPTLSQSTHSTYHIIHSRCLINASGIEWLGVGWNKRPVPRLMIKVKVRIRPGLESKVSQF